MERDNWTCQICGSRQNLQIHHRQLRSQQSPDEDSNLITLQGVAMNNCTAAIVRVSG
jgi:hypothetical protein